MADSKKLSDLTRTTSLSSSDEFVVVDKSSTSGVDASSTGRTSKIRFDDLKVQIGSQGQKGQKGQAGQDGDSVKGQKGQAGQDGESVKGQKGQSGDSVKGQKGEIGVGQKGQKGEIGVGQKGQKGQAGQDGNSVKGQKGQKGDSVKGQKGQAGQDGNSVKGQKGQSGDSVKGQKGQGGQKGQKGQGGLKGEKGIPGPTDPYVKQLSDTSTPDYYTASSRRVNPNSKNPTNHHYAVSTFGNQGNVTGQLATHFVSGQLYSRGFNSTWSSWKKYLTTDAPIQLSSTADQKIILQGSSNPYIRFREGTTDKAYIQWNSNGQLYLVNQETGSHMTVADSRIVINGKHGNMQIGAMNTTHAHFYTDRGSYYFNKTVNVDGALKDYKTGKAYIHEGNINTIKPQVPALVARGRISFTNNGHGLDNAVSGKFTDLGNGNILKSVTGTYAFKAGDIAIITGTSGGTYKWSWGKGSTTYTWSCTVSVNNSKGTWSANVRNPNYYRGAKSCGFNIEIFRKI